MDEKYTIEEAVDYAYDNEQETYKHLLKLPNGIDRQMSAAIEGLVNNAGFYADQYWVSESDFNEELKRRGYL